MYQTVGIGKPIDLGLPAKIHSFARVDNSCYNLSQNMAQVAGITKKEPVGVIPVAIIFSLLGLKARFLH
jgi:hypothetical protein